VRSLAELVRVANQAGITGCVVLDLDMPGVSGFEILTHLSDNRVDIPVIIVTGYHSSEIERRIRTALPVAYLRKTSTRERCSMAIRAAFTGRDAKRADRRESP
jgi:FixJ family two-component response regulator